MSKVELSKEEKLRYNRHLLLPEIGEKGQQKLKQARVLVIGAGGLGAPILQYLTAAGVGTIGVSDFDVVDTTNLQRQVLFDESDVGKPKVEVVIKKLAPKNALVRFNSEEGIKKENALQIIEQYDVIVDGSDNFATKYLVNDACVILSKPLVFGSIYQFTGQISVFNVQLENNERSGNYRDVFPEQPEADSILNCAEAGVLGVLPGIVGSLQANEVIKFITGIDDLLINRLLAFDALKMTFQEFNYAANKEYQTITMLGEYENVCDNKQKIIKEISANELKEWINSNKEFQLIDVREKEEFSQFNIGGELIPMSSVEGSIQHINKEIPVVMVCQSGIRSQHVVALLRQKHSFSNLYNLQGGLNQWVSN